jgi:hypothetical protein
MTAAAVITIHVDRRAVREAVIDLRCASLRSLALCRDIIDRLGAPRPGEIARDTITEELHDAIKAKAAELEELFEAGAEIAPSERR